MLRKVTINKLWWEHLVPRSMRSRLREVEKLLNEFIQSSKDGKEWIKVPEIRMVFLGLSQEN